MNVLLLAAGLGTRLRPLTDNTAKPAVEILGRPMIAYPLYQLAEFCRVSGTNVDNLVVNLHHSPASMVAVMAQFFGISEGDFKDAFFKFDGSSVEIAKAFEISSKHFTRHQNFARKLVFSFEHPRILDSGGGIKQPEKFLVEGSLDHFLVINADSLFFASPDAYKNFYSVVKRAEFDSYFLCSAFNYDPSVVGALWKDNKGRIVSFGKSKGKESGLTPLHNIGFYFLSKKVLSLLPAGESKIFDVLGKPNVISMGHLEKSIEWFETGDFKTFKTLEKDLDLRTSTAKDLLGAQILATKKFF